MRATFMLRVEPMRLVGQSITSRISPIGIEQELKDKTFVKVALRIS